MVDLHMHSTFSDGSLTPAELVQRACEAGVSTLALTDHDTTRGVGPFLEACRGAGLRGVPGVEISVDFGPGTLHMIGLFIDPQDGPLQDVLVRLRTARETRNQEILAKLNRMGHALTWDEVAKFAGEDVVGRPHFAMALIEKGVVKDKEEAFERLLGKGKPAYTDRYRLSAMDSIAMIRAAGGVPVLAHPFTLGYHRNRLRTFVAELAGQGLQAMEVYYSEHTPEQQRQLQAIAAEFGLAPSGGSDFHGALNPDIRIGRGFGSLAIPDDVVDLLHARATRH